MAAMQDMMTSDLELKSFMSVKLALPKESAETQYNKPSTATQKQEIGINDETQSRVTDFVQDEQSFETSSNCSASSVSSFETSETSPSSETNISTASPAKETAPSLDDRSLPTPPKPVPSIKCANRSGFYTHFGQPTYFGTRLYQPSELAPEEGIFGEWLELGCGETSSTRLVKVMPDDRLSAAKIVYNHHPEDEFRNELDAHHLVQGHPSFPEVIGVVHQSPFRCILQEFVGNESIPENITLEDALRNNKVIISDIPEKDWLQIGQDICQGLQHLHDQGYIHQDLSPDNILLYATDGNWRCWRAKICDLGNCTFAKLTPEGIKGQAQLAMAADVHSLGKIFKLVGKEANVHFLKSIGKKCSRRNPKNRPQMNKVCKMLSKVSH
ncbi:probable LIM domain-containing serine/threonine-protein kinase DDB_G0287001 [Asterias rubens]|uniref:probable LIM domain-containing serine/threonine-protein kinase DDB_G0287001 n=1 Tax=Asterias rubens TaxID=7604 RepID=UPI0014557EC9|nr:probable LIM domain-containing serine/threonine-protein kinase DDB_G0287001 [Asterias rubens]